MQFHDAALGGMAYLAEILGTISGFGSSTFFVPSALFFESFRLVLVLTAISHCFGNFFKILIFRQDFSWKPFLWLFLPSIFFSGLGAALSAELANDTLPRLLGAFLVLFALFALFGKKRLPRLPTWVAMLLSALSGFSTGLLGTGGAIRGVALGSLNLPKGTFVALSSAIDIGGDLVRAAIYLGNGYMDWRQWYYLPILLVAAFLGARSGKFLLARIRQEHFERIVALFILASGLMMVFRL
jgi:uncharacterized membrane protein YfcA